VALWIHWKLSVQGPQQHNNPPQNIPKGWGGRQQTHHNINQSLESTKGPKSATQWQCHPPQKIQMAPFSLKGMINTILETRITNRSERIDGFLSRHPNLNSSDLNLLENIAGGVLHIKLCIKVHPTPFRPKEIKTETPKNI